VLSAGSWLSWPCAAEVTAAVDHHTQGLLMAPSYAVPRLLARHGLRFDDIDTWKIHEVFAAQVLANVAAIERDDWIRSKTGVDADFGAIAGIVSTRKAARLRSATRSAPRARRA
jgi:acetyl-CoA acetyltransferase